MCAWQVHSYGGTEELQLSCSVRDPVISKPDDVLVNVSASSVNPIDVAMMSMFCIYICMLYIVFFETVFLFSMLLVLLILLTLQKAMEQHF